jgi:hypothetical protein
MLWGIALERRLHLDRRPNRVVLTSANAAQNGRNLRRSGAGFV